MKKNKHRFLKFFLCSGIFLLAFFAFRVFTPVKYQNVPELEKKDSLQFWDLPTGSRIAYTRLQGKGRMKPYPIIYLHGGPGGPVSNQVIQELAFLQEDGYTLYFYDQVGGGYSERLERITDYTAQRHSEDLAAIVEETGAEKVILIGQSWGGMLASLFVAGHPDRVSAMILTCPGPIFPVNASLRKIPPPDSLHLKNPLYTNAMANASTETLRTKVTEWIARKIGIRCAGDQEMDDFAAILSSKAAKSTVCDTLNTRSPLAGSGYYVQIMTMKSLDSHPDYREKLGHISCPVMIMKGECDFIPWGFTLEYLQLFPKSEFSLIQGAGHSIGREQPELYRNTIREFLIRQFP